MYSNPNKKWACVQWKDEINFSVVSMSDFYKIKDDEEYEENIFYKVKFGNSKYNARLVCMGSKDFCKKTETKCLSAINSQLNSQPSTHQNTQHNIQQRVSKTVKVIDDLEKEKNYEIELLKQENNEYKSKIEKLENLIIEKDRKIESLENKPNVNSLNGFQDISKNRMTQFAVAILNSFGTNDDMALITLPEAEKKLVTISPHFKEYQIPLNVHLNLQADIHAGKKHTILFRQLVKAVIPNTSIWAERTADSMEKQFPIVQACRDYVQNYRRDFVHQIYMKTLRELCSEAEPKNEPKDYENVENKTIKRKSTASNISNKKIKILSPIENNQAHFSATNSLETGKYYQQQLQPPLSQPNQQQFMQTALPELQQQLMQPFSQPQQQLMQPPLPEQQQQLLQSQRLFQQQQFLHYQPNQQHQQHSQQAFESTFQIYNNSQACSNLHSFNNDEDTLDGSPNNIN